MKYNDAAIEKNVLNVLKHTFGSDVGTSTFIPVGEESYAFSIVLNNGSKYFIKYCDKQKIIKSIDKVNALLLQLKEFDFVIPPIEVNRKTSFEVGNGKIYVYPFVEGSSIRMGNEKFDKQLVDTLTGILVSIHSANPKILVDLPQEEFENNYDQRLEQILVAKNSNNLYHKATLLLENNEKIIRSMIEKQNQVANAYKQKSPDLVLTHGDVTGLNIIVTKEGHIKLVDWDGSMLTPPERDLNFLFDNPNFSLDKYIQLSGHKHFDLQMKEYYGRQWALDSIVENFENLLNGSKSKADNSEYLEEIEEYLSFYK